MDLVLPSLAGYFGVVVLARMSGKRLLAEVGAFDAVLLEESGGVAVLTREQEPPA